VLTAQSLKHLKSPLSEGANYKFEQICTFVLHQHFILMNARKKRKKETENMLSS